MTDTPVDYRRRSSHRSMQVVAVLLGVLTVVGAVVWAGMNIKGGSAPKRQIAHIAVLPDTPPPPPPPEEKPPPPREQKTMPKPLDMPKPQVLEQPQQLKMEGQAGEGPSPFAAGPVQQDYIGGDVGAGARNAAYVARIGQRLQEELTRRRSKVSRVKIYLWLQSDGVVQKVTYAGDPESEKQVRLAFADLRKVDEPPPPDMPMPMGLEISSR